MRKTIKLSERGMRAGGSCAAPTRRDRISQIIFWAAMAVAALGFGSAAVMLFEALTR